MRRLTFPAGFLWGVATSSHQNEGNNHNNDFWAWEQIPGHVADHSTSGLVADWWRSAEADFDRAADLGLNTLRLSVEWSRLEPQPGVWDSAAFDRYRVMLHGLHERGIRPMVTLHHFSNPVWLAERGGWANPAVVRHFERYVSHVAAELGDLVNVWGTINEPYIYAAMAYMLGDWPPGQRSLLQLAKVMRHQANAHAAAYHAIHQVQPGAQVGVVKHLAGFDPYRPLWPGDRGVAALMDALTNWRFLDAITSGRFKLPLGLGLRRNLIAQGTNDFIGVNYYGRSRLRLHWRDVPVPAPPDLAWPVPWVNREIYPRGLYRFLMKLRRYDRPVYITENGLADSTDLIRPGFLLAHLANVHHAIQDGADVRAYYHWTLVDNYEWTEGWTTRFGLFGLDTETQARTMRRSARLYREIIAANGITEEMVANHAPHIMAQVFDSADEPLPVEASEEDAA
ncbi:MAG: glycoside hydrolase family 1 protein [Anaerolineae bacterium]|nr:glycoside hydrolase family 1 protein [Anaerolineae bacterium]